MSNKLFKGIMPALVSPINEDSTLRVDALTKIVEYELSGGVAGFYINGATGEGVLLPESTRIALAEAVMGLCGKSHSVINHVGAVDTQSALRLAKHSGQIKCSAISSLIPNYINKYAIDNVLDYYKRLTDASGLPVLVYCTGLLDGNPYDFMEKAINIDGIIGCKYTLFDYNSLHRITELNAGDINVINGPDEMLVCGLLMGADGGIGSTYNLMPEKYVALLKAFRSGDIIAARNLQYEVNRVINVLIKYNCIRGIKEAFNIMGFGVGNAAYPEKPFSGAERQVFIADMTNAGYAFNK